MIQTETVVGRLTDTLRRDISIGVLKPGTKLRIEDVRDWHKVSHPSVREALSILAGEGYVTATQQRGFKVAECSLEDLLDLSQVRCEMECLALEWSLKNSDTNWRSSVVAAHHALREVERELAKEPASFLTEWDQRNRGFHLTIAGNCRSPRLIETITRQYDLSRRYRYMAYSLEPVDRNHLAWLHASSTEHIELKEAVLQSDLAAGKRILRGHINKTVDDWGTNIVNLADKKKA